MPRAGRLVATLAILLVLGACAAPAPRLKDQAPLTWPEEVEVPARIAFVDAFSRPEDLGIEKGFFQRVGEFLFGASDARLVRPMAVVAVKGVIYVADPGAKGVHRFDPAAGRYDLIGAGDDAPLPSPVGLAAGSDGEVYVADSVLASVLVIHPGATAAVPVPLPKLGQPTGMAFDRDTHRLYVVDTTAHRVNVFNRDGSLELSFGQRGADDGEFNYPTQIWRDAQGRFFVTDSLNFRVQVVDGAGRYLKQFGQAGDGAGDFMRQKGVATDSYGHIYIVDALQGALQIFDEAGHLLLVLGNLGQDRGQFWLPAGIFIDENDFIYVADSYNRRVQIFRYIGGPT
jgi:DNA-binding beta-propeller fold protein YncE